jgi:enoyl-CoA hydratase/carnithine racemase
MSDADVRVRLESREGGEVAVVTLDHAARLNVLNSHLMDRFVAVFADLGRRETLRAVVLTGAGDRAFVGGADVDEMATLSGPDEARAFIGKVHACCAAVRDLPVPVIALIKGWCLGAGLELACACDLRLACEDARLGMPEVRLGIPSVVEAALLPGLIGWGRTRDLLLFGEVIDAPDALRMGLVESVWPREGLDAALETKLSALLAAGPRAIRLQKSLIRQWEGPGLERAIAAGIDAFAKAFEGAEPREAMRAFQSARAARRARSSAR